MATILTVSDLHKRLALRPLFQGISFAVEDRDRIAIIGANGAGKSTLLKMLVRLAGIDDEDASFLEPDSGTITWKRGLTLEYVAQEPKFAPGATVASALDRPDVPAHERDAIALGLKMPPMEAQIETLSIGERRRVALGHALLSGADVLALDEPTNHLDAPTIAWLETRLQSWRGAILVVTHDRYFLDQVASRIMEVDRGKAYVVEGSYGDFLVLQAERQAQQAENEYQRTSFIRREIDWIRRMPKARGTKAKARIDRFDAAVSAAPTIHDIGPSSLDLRLPAGPRLGNTIVELHAVSKTLGGKSLFQQLSLILKPGDRIGIVGENGAGKSTLVKTILGELTPDAGKVVVGQNTRIAHLEQGRSDLRDELTVIEDIGNGYDHIDTPEGKIHIRGFLRQLGFRDATMDVKVGQLSGGERNRVQLAKLLCKAGNLLILDEPTNDLDLITLASLEDALAHFAGCALIVSHDRWFLDRVATGILAFEGEGRVVFYEGDYTSYANKRVARTKAAKPESKRNDTSPPISRSAQPKAIKLTFKEARELEGMERAIGDAEANVARLEAVLSDPEVFRQRAAEVQGFIAELEAAKLNVAALYDRWSELDAKAKLAGAEN